MFILEHNSNRHSTKRNGNSARPSLFEPLESRQLMSAGASLIDGILRVDGSIFADTITVDTVRGLAEAGTSPSGPTVQWIEQLRVRISNATESLARYFTASEVTRLDVYAGGSSDRLDTTAVNQPTRVFGGAGNDTIATGGASDSVWGEAGNDHVILGAGDDYFDGGTGSDTA